MTPTTAEIVRLRWAALGLALRSGVDDSAVAQAEVRLGVRLPAGMVALWKAVDGMAPGDWDDQLLRFWPLQEIGPVGLDVLGLDSAAHCQLFLFADWSLWAHAYAVDLGHGPEWGSVWLIGGRLPLKIAGSFAEFVELYLSNSDRLFAPEGS